MKNKVFGLVGTALVAVLMAGAAHASDVKLSGTAGMSTDYISRGYSFTSGDPQVFANVQANFAEGFNAGVWGSNVDLGTGNSEFGFYVGNTREYGNLTVGLDAYYYTYPDVNNIDYWEFGAHAGYDFDVATLGGSLYYSPNYFADTGAGWYKTVTLTVPVTDRVALYGTGGHQSLNCGPNAWDYGVGVTYEFVDGYSLDLGWNGVDDKFGGDDNRVTATLTASF